MDIVYRLGEASVADVVGHMPDEPAYNSVRVTLSSLEGKGYVKHRREKRRVLYSPVLSPARATRSAMSHMKNQEREEKRQEQMRLAGL